MLTSQQYLCKYRTPWQRNRQREQKREAPMKKYIVKLREEEREDLQHLIAQGQASARKLEVHYTPKHGSWLNMAEIELSVLSRQCLDRRIGKLPELE